jgi:hypothetical protein
MKRKDYYVDYSTKFGKWCVYKDLTDTLRESVARRDNQKEAEELAKEMNREARD